LDVEGIFWKKVALRFHIVRQIHHAEFYVSIVLEAIGGRILTEISLDSFLLMSKKIGIGSEIQFMLNFEDSFLQKTKSEICHKNITNRYDDCKDGNDSEADSGVVMRIDVPDEIAHREEDYAHLNCLHLGLS
jgi:hypothetical protein